MLDVHPPEHAAHTWTDFFIHIGTIVVGLCIAVGLEQTVEFFHHRIERKEAKTHIHEELAGALQMIDVNVVRLKSDDAALKNDASILEASPSPQSLKNLSYSWLLNVLPSAVWETARQTGVLELIPLEDTERYAYTSGYWTCCTSMAALTSAMSIQPRQPPNDW